MEAMRTVYAEKRDSVTTHSSILKGKRASFANKLYFAESFDEPGGKGAFQMRHSFPFFFPLVRISEFLNANFSSSCVRCTHLKS